MLTIGAHVVVVHRWVWSLAVDPGFYQSRDLWGATHWPCAVCVDVIVKRH